MIGLTPQHRALVDYIRAAIDASGVAPTQQEIGDHLHTSKGNVNRMLGILERNGVIRRFSKHGRGLEVIEGKVCPHCQHPAGSAACHADAAATATSRHLRAPTVHGVKGASTSELGHGGQLS